MDYEKKYRDLVEAVKELQEANPSDEGIQKWVEDNIPELKESEDLEIKSDIQYAVRCAYGDNSSKTERALAWLGKQSAKKHQYKSRPRYVGEAELLGANKQGEQIPANSAKTCKDEQEPTDKVEPKFKVGDVMRTLQEAADNITSGLPVVVSIDNDNEYYRCTNELIAIKDQDDYEYPPMNRRQRIAWSAQDDLFLLVCKNALEKYQKSDNWDANIIIDWLGSKLKSLKPQNRWKPSDEMLKALDIAIRAGIQLGSWEEKALRELQKQLKVL